MTETKPPPRQHVLSREWKELRRLFHEASLSEMAEGIIIMVITVAIMVVAALATWGLVRELFALIFGDLADPMNNGVFQSVFGNIFTVIIALEFRGALRISFVEHKEIMRGRTIMLVALLAVARKFILLDPRDTSPEELIALAIGTLALGVVYWLMREQDLRLTGNGHEEPHE